LTQKRAQRERRVGRSSAGSTTSSRLRRGANAIRLECGCASTASSWTRSHNSRRRQRMGPPPGTWRRRWWHGRRRPRRWRRWRWFRGRPCRRLWWRKLCRPWRRRLRRRRFCRKPYGRGWPGPRGKRISRGAICS